MTLPATPKVEIRFGIGAGFGNVFVLGSSTDGILGTNVFGSQNTQVVEITDTVTRISTRRGRDRVFNTFNPGSASIQFNDLTGDFNPDNAAGPYYGQIVPMCQVRCSATYSGNAYYLFTGYVTAWDWTWDPGAQFGRVTISAVDGFHALNLLTIDSVPGGAAGQYTGQRIDDLLDAAVWPTTLRNISTGTVTCQADPGGARVALGACQLIEATETGAFYMDGTGNATFLDHDDLGLLSNGTATVFDDDGTDIQYQSIDVSLDETELANVVTVTREGGTPQTVSDATSIETYYRRNYGRSGLMMQTDEQALAQANYLLTYKKNATLRIDSIGLDLSSPSNRVAAGLQLDIGDPVVINRHYAGTTITADLAVQGMSHDISPDRWFTTISTAERVTAFILGSATSGILGTSRF